MPAAFSLWASIYQNVHCSRILCKLHLEGDYSTPSNAYRPVKTYTNFDVKCNALNIETASRQTVWMRSLSSTCWPTTAMRQDTAFTYQTRTKKEFASALNSVIWGLVKTSAQYEASKLKPSPMKVTSCPILMTDCVIP
uniref:Uncharacterized protein n=2 Tax=Ursus TaxID=9639 RepID=A0A452U6U8_URSMA